MSDGAATSPADALADANEKVRSAGKWLVASAAAVGATMLAGTQLSSLGALALDEVRFWVAAVGGVVALAAVGYVIWSSARLLLPVLVTANELATNTSETASGKELSKIHTFLQTNKYTQGFPTVAALWQDRECKEAELARLQATGSADPEQVQSLVTEVTDRETRIQAVEAIAQNRLVATRAHRLFSRLLYASAAAALGVVCFVWASNPPATGLDLSNTSLVDADLRDADLTNADLSHADLTGADLTGADLTGADLAEVTWSDTTCPDGDNSDDVGGTCRGHR